MTKPALAGYMSIEKAGTYECWKGLKKEQKREKRKSRSLRGVVSLLRQLLAK